MDVPRTLTKSVASRSSNWTTNIIKSSTTYTSTPSHLIPRLNNRRPITLSHNAQQGIGNGSSPNRSYKFRNRSFCRREIQTISNTETSHLSSQSTYQNESFDASAGSVQDPSVLSNGSREAKIPIREQLRRWEIENVGEVENISFDVDFGKAGQVANLLTRPVEGNEIQETDDLHLSEGLPLPLLDMDDLVNFGSRRSYLLRGDLVEIRSVDGSRFDLAIFVQDLGKQAQFYTMSGKWVHRASRSAGFFVPNFVSREEVSPLLPYLPAVAVPEAMEERLQSLKNNPPRLIGSRLLQKMADFWNEADAVYRKHVDTLHNSYDNLALSRRALYMTLPELTKQLLKLQQNIKDENIAPSALYAVYRAIMQEDVGFSAQTAGNCRAWGRFEVVPKKIMDTNNMVTRIVRSWQTYTLLSSRGGKSKSHRMGLFMSEFEEFLKRAGGAIDMSRKHRVPSMNGQVGPAKVDALGADNAGETAKSHFAQSDVRYIQFIKCWVAWDTFSLTSTMNGIGSVILRATGRYNEYTLDRSTGWLFLQEIGIISPWETKAPFQLRLPGYAYDRGTMSPQLSNTKPRDNLAELRKNWGDLPVYCIDNTEAHEIDDGVSVEASEAEGEHWVHVHVANPGSLFGPTSHQAIQARKSTSSVYLPDRFVPMLQDDAVQENLSLAPNRPTLTFSAKVNMQGEIIDHKITPGTIHNVVYLTPATLGEVIGKTAREANEAVTVGNSDLPTTSNDGVTPRDMVAADELLPSHKANLKVLASLAAARRRYTCLRGGLDLSRDHSHITVKTGNDFDTNFNTKNPISTHVYSDPFIQLTIPPIAAEPTPSPVTSLMTLAGEVAAMWCSARNIPIIYYVSQDHPDVSDSGEHFRTHILPYVLRNERPPEDVQLEYLYRLGRVMPSSTPGPHVALGVDAYTKCTSPLRRYGDLLGHWQIEAALVEEAKTGESLVGSTREDYLPFTKSELDEFIPILDSKEKQLAVVSRNAQRNWTLQAILRAWKFGEGREALKEEWEFTVVSARHNRVVGNIERLGVLASMDLPDGLEAEDIDPGEVFVGRIADVNTYDGILRMEPLRRVKEELPEQDQQEVVGME